MLFQIYGETAGFQLLGWLMVFVGLILANEFARRTKWGGIACFLVLPAGLTIYFISIYVGAAMGAQWALNNPTYVYLNLPTHTWYCGLALLLAPTVANALWNKGGWIQNRANTLALWCMFAQVFPLFQDRSIFTTLPVLYADGFMDAAIRPTLVNPVPQGVISIASLAINVLALALIIKRSKEQKKNPYKQEIFTDAKDFQLAMARAEDK